MEKNNNPSLKEKSAKPQDAAKFLRHFLLDGLGELIEDPGQPFLKFLPVISGIEFLGACYDEFPFDKQGECKRRFTKGISLMGERYKPFYGSQTNEYPCLYTDFRCPMVHQFRTNQDKFRLTAVNIDSDEVRAYHLQVYDGVHIIVLEVLYEDFARAVKSTIEEIQTERLVLEKLKEDHVVIRDVGVMSTT